MSKASIFLISALVVILDRLTKHFAAARLPLDVQAVTLIPHVLFLTRTSNTGSAFGLFPGSTAFLAVVAAVCAIGVAIYIIRAKQRLPVLLAIGLALPLGGAVGNFYDRAFHGFVVDFIDLWLGSYEWPVFNVADSCICIGVALIAIYTIRVEAHPAKLNAGSEPESAEMEQTTVQPK
jgi:signal peptidase II